MPHLSARAAGFLSVKMQMHPIHGERFLVTPINGRPRFSGSDQIHHGRRGMHSRGTQRQAQNAPEVLLVLIRLGRFDGQVAGVVGTRRDLVDDHLPVPGDEKLYRKNARPTQIGHRRLGNSPRFLGGGVGDFGGIQHGANQMKVRVHLHFHRRVGSALAGRRSRHQHRDLPIHVHRRFQQAWAGQGQIGRTRFTAGTIRFFPSPQHGHAASVVSPKTEFLHRRKSEIAEYRLRPLRVHARIGKLREPGHRKTGRLGSPPLGQLVLNHANDRRRGMDRNALGGDAVQGLDADRLDLHGHGVGTTGI